MKPTIHIDMLPVELVYLLNAGYKVELNKIDDEGRVAITPHKIPKTPKSASPKSWRKLWDDAKPSTYPKHIGNVVVFETEEGMKMGWLRKGGPIKNTETSICIEERIIRAGLPERTYKLFWADQIKRWRYAKTIEIDMDVIVV